LVLVVLLVQLLLVEMVATLFLQPLLQLAVAVAAELAQEMGATVVRAAVARRIVQHQLVVLELLIKVMQVEQDSQMEQQLLAAVAVVVQAQSELMELLQAAQEVA
jgi:hypothetical protein